MCKEIADQLPFPENCVCPSLERSTGGSPEKGKSNEKENSYCVPLQKQQQQQQQYNNNYNNNNKTPLQEPLSTDCNTQCRYCASPFRTGAPRHLHQRPEDDPVGEGKGVAITCLAILADEKRL